jgi:hypothetical protein
MSEPARILLFSLALLSLGALGIFTGFHVG